MSDLSWERAFREVGRSGVYRGADLCGCDLSGLDLSGYDLAGANLEGANLEGADLSGANLTVAEDLSGANLRNANLRDANLSGADMSDAYLQGAELIGAELIGAKLRGANLEGANLDGAKLLWAKFDRPSWAPPAEDLRRMVADHIEAHPKLHNQKWWGDGADDPECGTPCCVAGWAAHLGGGCRNLTVATFAALTLHIDGKPMPRFDCDASRKDILAALRA